MAEEQGTTRRRFLGGLGGIALAPALAARGGRPASAARPDWGSVRAEFDLDAARIPMNAGNLCPSPRSVAETVCRLTAAIDRDVSYTNRARLHDALEASRRAVAAHLGAEPDEIALVRNTTEANATVIHGLELGPGDEVLVWTENHPTNNVAWDVAAARRGFRVRRVATPRRPRGEAALAEPFVAALGPSTRVVALTHVSNTTGVRLPVRAIADEAHRRGAFVHVDGAQSWGALAVDVRGLGCDAFAASAHKWPCGPKEAGALFVRRPWIERLWPHTVGFGWGEGVEPGPAGARRFESLGQRDDAALAAVAETIAFHRRIGPERIEERVLELAGRLLDGLAAAGLPVATPRDARLRAGVCLVEVPPERRRPLVFRLDALGVAGSPAGGLRLCPHVYNDEEDVDRAVRAVERLRDAIVA